jgi:hydroxyacylglutathione hydrolase
MSIQIHRTESEGWLSNAYLVVASDGHHAVLVDGNGVSAPHLERIEREDLDVTVILLTHHHADHVVLDGYRALGAPILAHEGTARELGGDVVDQTLVDGEVLRTGGMEIEALHTPGHAYDHLAFLIDGTDCITGDVIFQGTVGGTRAPGATGLEDLRASIDRIMALPGETRLHPGHREPTTIAEEARANPFVLAWRGGMAPEAVPCKVGGERAELLLWGPDYDGTNKAWVRFGSGVEAVVGGSQVERE